MKRTVTICCALLAGMPLADRLRAATDDEVAARRTALDLAAAWANDGFKLRDGHWAGPVTPKKPVVIEVNLYAGNDYWFSVAATDKAVKMAVAVFDERGQPVKCEDEPFQDGARAATLFSPEISGPYFVRIEEAEGGPAAACLVYSYR